MSPQSPARKKQKKETPLLVDCHECDGHGNTQARCAHCGKHLTEENVEPGSDDCCAACAGEDGDVHPNGGYSAYGCKCSGCAA